MLPQVELPRRIRSGSPALCRSRRRQLAGRRLRSAGICSMGRRTRRASPKPAHLVKRAEFDEQRTDSAIRLQVRRAYAGLNAAQQRIEVARAAVAEAEESLRITQNRYEAGMNNVTDLLRTETAVLESRTRYLAAIHDQRIAATMLELAAGRLERGFGGSELMKPYFLFLPIPVLLLTSCGSEPPRRAAQPQTPPVAVHAAAVAARGLARELRSHRHGPRAHDGHHFEQSDGLRAAGERTSGRPCSRRAAVDHPGRARPGCEPAPRRSRPRRGRERHPRTGERHGRRQSQSGSGADHLQAHGGTGGQEVDFQSGVR